MTVLVEVRGGIAETQTFSEEKIIHIDYDNLGDDYQYAFDVYQYTPWYLLPTKRAESIKEFILEIWPEMVDDISEE